MNIYTCAWSVDFPATDAQFAWLATLIDAVHEALAGNEDANETLKKYPTFVCDIADCSSVLTYEKYDGRACIYNDVCDGGSEQAAEIVLAFLKHFESPLRIGFMVASTDRNDAWGGCWHITKHKAEWKSLGYLLEQMTSANEIDWRNNPQILT